MSRIPIYACLLLTAGLPCCHSPGDQITIGYVQMAQDPSLDNAKEGVFRALADSGFINGQNIKVLDNNAQGDLSMISSILQTLVTRKVDLIITNSTPCMSAAAYAVKDIPVVFTVSFSPWHVGISQVPGNLYGVYEELWAEEFADMILVCMPDLDCIGIPYNNAEPNAGYASGVFRQEFAGRGIRVVTAPVTSTNDLLQSAQYLAGQRIGAFITAADNTVNLGLPILIRVAADMDIPLFVTDPPQAEKGAAMAYGSSYGNWGYQAGLKAVEILRNRASLMEPIEPNRNLELVINLRACADQGLDVPQELIDRANRIIR